MDGYGKVFKSIMRNPELTVEARGIYAYFCSIAGADDSCYPSLATVLHDLNITKQRFYKHLNLLIEGRFGKTIYRINQPRWDDSKSDVISDI